MPFCPNCGTPLSQNATVCHQCGSRLINNQTTGRPANTIYQTPTFAPAQPYVAPADRKPVGSIKPGLLTWSIINLIASLFCMFFFFSFFALMPLPQSVAALILTCSAPSSDNENLQRLKNKVALMLNIISTFFNGSVLFATVAAILFNGLVFI